MLSAVAKVIISAIIISFVSWLSGKKTSVAGFLTALPLTTLLALAFSRIEWQNSAQTVEYAKSIFLGVPLSLLFFVPFLLAEKFSLGFWSCYTSGIFLLGVGFVIHTKIIS